MTPLPDSFLQRPIAHRALHDGSPNRPENSIAAIRAAIASGYAVELDIQPSSDRVAMVFHDYDLRRLTATKGAIAQRHAHELEQLPLLGGAENVPSLKRALQEINGQVPVLLEVKDQDHTMGPFVGALERAIAEDVTDYQGDLALMSFNPHTVARLTELLPDRPIGRVTCDFNGRDWPQLTEDTRCKMREIPEFESSGASFISHQATDLDRPRVAEIKSKGAAILCWTVRSQAEEAIARKIADNITFEGYTA